ncbi:MAG: alcohol dehydrogenase catalytic domain-containing protein [Planctomycetes bacterium]|nr:alcohol dehydrogenase catalytic domain-containing protein [Planctomycetota bacterium]
MRAVYISAVGTTEIRDVPVPAIADGAVLIRVEYAGICGSDYHIFTGRHEFRKPPVIPGHELSGRVERVGSAVTGVRPGDRVTVLPQVACGTCRFCRADRPMLCRDRIVPGTDRWIGAFVELFNAPEAVVFPIPDGVDLKTAVLAEPLAVACHCLGRIPAENRRGLLIHGAGSVGLLALAAARKNGFGAIVVTDVVEYNLQRARQLGADRAVHATGDIDGACRQVFGREGPASVLFTAGGEAALQQSLDVADHGATIVYVAMVTAAMTLHTRSVVARELSLVGSRTYSRRDFTAALELLAEDPALFATLVTHVLPVSRVQDGFDLMQGRREGFVKLALAMTPEGGS